MTAISHLWLGVGGKPGLDGGVRFMRDTKFRGEAMPPGCVEVLKAKDRKYITWFRVRKKDE